MKKNLIYFVVGLIVILGLLQLQGKTDHKRQDEQNTTVHGSKGAMNFNVYLTGSDEVPPVRTQATGRATFQVTNNGNDLHYKLTVTDIENVSMAHIHIGSKGKEGAIVVWLYPVAPPPVLLSGKSNGVIAEGDITSANLIGPLQGKDLSSLLKMMENGQVYVNIHTSQHPDGEIRGEF
jgi:hypothetical protein